MTVEVLFPELGSLYGDMANVRYLQACAPDLEFVFTDKHSTPRFVSDHVDMLYLSAMPESKQEMAISQLMPHVQRLKELVEAGTVVLATGNAMEIFGQYITDGDRKINALGLFPFHAERNMQIEQRHNSMFLGDFDGMKIVGCRSQFSFCRGEFSRPFIQVLGGCGNNPEDPTEGIHYKNLFATYLLGPFLVLNPLFTKYLLRLMGHDDTLAFEKEAMDAYQLRLSQLEAPNANFHIG